ncbi:hypothetical protein CHUAL_007231 [Chamberlinius hualienensis]
MSMDMRQAQNQFQQIFDNLRRRHKEEFLHWIFETVGRTAFESLAERMQQADQRLSEIVSELREVLPLSGILDSETIHIPKTGVVAPIFSNHAEFDHKHTVPVDAFLYDDFMLDQLCEEGKLKRNYCKDCNSTNTSPLTFISHSMSKRRLQFLFMSLLPDLQGKTVLDIGSRLGTVLYGAYNYGNARRIIGIEMNSDFCDLQRRMIDKYSMADRIQVVCDDIRNRPDLIQEADVIIAHSVVDFFLPQEDHLNFWKFLYENSKQSGKFLITTPSIDRALSNFQAGIDICSWVTPVHNPQLMELEAQNDPDFAELKLYRCQ